MNGFNGGTVDRGWFLSMAVAALLMLTTSQGFGAEAERPESQESHMEQGKAIVVLDDFESYRTGADVRRAWFQPGHSNTIHLDLDNEHKCSGKQGLRFDYTTDSQKKHAEAARVSNWRKGGWNALRFWYQPDGSGHGVFVRLNTGDHNMWEYSFPCAVGDTAPHIATLPVSQCNRPAWAEPERKPPFRAEDVMEVCLCVNAWGGAPVGSGTFYFDDVVGVRVDEGAKFTNVVVRPPKSNTTAKPAGHTTATTGTSAKPAGAPAQSPKVDEPANSKTAVSPRDAALRAYGRALVGHTNAAASAGGSTTAVPVPAASATTNRSGEP